MVARKLLAVLAFSAALIGCPSETGKTGNGGSGSGSGESSGEKPIKIALAGPITGSVAAMGNEMKQAAELWTRQIGEKGGIKGRRVELVVEDDKGNANEATNVAKKIASDPDIVAVVGHFNSSCTKATRDTYNQAGILEFSPASTDITVCRGYDWTFRNLYHDGYQGMFIVRYVKEVLGHSKIAIAYENDDYGRGLRDAIIKKAAEVQVEVVAEQTWVREQTQDLKTVATALQAQKPQTIVIAGLYNEAALLAKSIRNDLGWKDVQLIGSDGVVNDDFIKIAGDAGEGTLLTTPYFFSAESSAEAKAFGEAFKAAYNVTPGTWAALTYDALAMVGKGIEAVGADRKALRDWFAGCKDSKSGFVGVTGTTYFDEHGDCPSKPAAVIEVQNGAYVLAPKQLAAE